MKKNYFVLTAMAVMLTFAVKAQTIIAGWNLKAYGSAGNSIPGSLNATSKDPNIEISILSRGLGLSPSDVNFSYFSNVSSSSATGNTASDAVVNGDAYLVTLKAANGTMSLSKINYQLYRSLNGPNTFRWAYSINGGAFNDVGTSDVSYSGTDNLGLVQTSIDLSGITTLQNVPSSSTVIFRLLGWGATTGTKRFGIGRNSGVNDNSNVLSFEGSLSNTLPVSLTSFTAKSQGNSVVLNWKTTSEQHNSHFEILRAIDGINFSVIGQKAGNGSTNTLQNYSYIDTKPLVGTSYYALKQYDLDGKAEQYEAVPVKYSLSNSLFTLTASSLGINAQIEAAVEELALISVLDVSGNKITGKSVRLNKGVNQIELTNINLIAGKLYLVNLKSESQNHTIKIIK